MNQPSRGTSAAVKVSQFFSVLLLARTSCALIEGVVIHTIIFLKEIVCIRVDLHT